MDDSPISEAPEPLAEDPAVGDWRERDARNEGVINALGWAGTALILGAYALLSLEVLSTGPTYQLMNLFGAIGVGIVCWRQRTWQPLFLQVVWSAIAIISLMRMVR